MQTNWHGVAEHTYRLIVDGRELAEVWRYDGNHWRWQSLGSISREAVALGHGREPSRDEAQRAAESGLRVSSKARLP